MLGGLGGVGVALMAKLFVGWTGGGTCKLCGIWNYFVFIL